MNSEKPLILTCPHCGGEKQIMSIESEYTNGSELWSDVKLITPIYPEISRVQKCPHCGKYYLYSRHKEIYVTKGNRPLTFTEMKEAFAQLADKGFKDHHGEAMVRQMLFHSFNDYYYRFRFDTDIEVNPDDFALFAEQGRWLVDNYWGNEIWKAEYLREIGEFEQAEAVLESSMLRYKAPGWATTIMKKIKDRDKRVFCIREMPACMHIMALKK